MRLLRVALQDKDEKRSTAKQIPSGSCVELKKTHFRSGFVSEPSELRPRKRWRYQCRVPTLCRWDTGQLRLLRAVGVPRRARHTGFPLKSAYPIPGLRVETAPIADCFEKDAGHRRVLGSRGLSWAWKPLHFRSFPVHPWLLLKRRRFAGLARSSRYASALASAAPSVSRCHPLPLRPDSVRRNASTNPYTSASFRVMPGRSGGLFVGRKNCLR